MIGGECVSVYVKGERKTVRDGNGGSLQARREVRRGGIWQLFKKERWEPSEKRQRASRERCEGTGEGQGHGAN